MKTQRNSLKVDIIHIGTSIMLPIPNTWCFAYFFVIFHRFSLFFSIFHCFCMYGFWWNCIILHEFSSLFKTFSARAARARCCIINHSFPKFTFTLNPFTGQNLILSNCSICQMQMNKSIVLLHEKMNTKAGHNDTVSATSTIREFNINDNKIIKLKSTHAHYSIIQITYFPSLHVTIT